MATYTRSKAQAGRGAIFEIGPVTGAAAPPTGITGSTTSGSTAVTTVTTLVGLSVGMTVSGTGIAPGTTIAALGTLAFTLSQNATATGSTVAFTFGLPFLTVGELKVGDPGKGQFDKEDVSNFQSLIDKEYKKMMRDNGTPKLTGNRVSNDAGQLAVNAAYDDADNSYQIRITIPKRSDQTSVGDIYTYDALVMSRTFGPIETNKTIPFEVDLQITGPVAFAPGS
jgi:hypothetical protein